MYNKGRVLRERFSAGIARVRLFASVGPFVYNQRRSLMKSLAANIADQRLLSAVKSQMVLEGSLRRDGFATQVTVVFVLTGVRLDMNHQ